MKFIMYIFPDVFENGQEDEEMMGDPVLIPGRSTVPELSEVVYGNDINDAKEELFEIAKQELTEKYGYPVNVYSCDDKMHLLDVIGVAREYDYEMDAIVGTPNKSTLIAIGLKCIKKCSYKRTLRKYVEYHDS